MDMVKAAKLAWELWNKRQECTPLIHARWQGGWVYKPVVANNNSLSVYRGDRYMEVLNEDGAVKSI